MKYILGLVQKTIEKWMGRKWYHQRFDGSPYFLHFIAEAEVATHIARKEGGDFTVHYCFFENDKADWYIEMEDIKKVYTSVIEGGKRDPKWTEKLIARWDADEKTFYETCDRVGKIELEKLSDGELSTLHDDFVQKVLNRNSSSSIIDGFALGTDEIVAGKLKAIFETSPIKNSIKFSEFFSTLTAPVHLSFINDAEIALLEVAAKVKQDPGTRERLLAEHQKAYFWTRNNYVDAHILSVEHFSTELDAVLKAHPNLEADTQKIKATPERNRAAKEALLKEVPLDEELLFLIRTTEHFTRWQDERKRATFFAIHFGSLILGEMGRRIGVPIEELKYLSPREAGRILSEKPDRGLLQARRKNSVFYWDKEGHEAASGEQADEVKKKILGSLDLGAINDFRGLTACIGRATGKVKVVTSAKDVNKVEEGDILVAVMTRPDYVPAMKKAAAIVTDEGGITCHAAIVSRELQKPCIIGTKLATKVLKDGMDVEVDANHGMVKIMR